MIKSLSQWLKQQHVAMVEQLLAWCQINSGTFNLDGLHQMSTVLEQAFSVLDAKVEYIEPAEYIRINDEGKPVTTRLGKILSFVKRPEAPIQILLCGHMDTVYSIDNPFQHYQYLNDHTLNGPGVADMKGGLLVMLYALQAFEQFAEEKTLGWRVMINADEEISSPGSAAYIKQLAPQYDYGLVFEPALTADGVFAGQRKGSGNFTLIVHGKAAHVGRAFEQGNNALLGAAVLIKDIHALNQQREGVTINIGYCHGGGALNVVPDLAVCKLNIRIVNAKDENWFQEKMQQILADFSQQYAMTVEWHGQFTRLPKQLDEKQLAFYQLLTQAAAEQGIPAIWQATGGCCDGNNLAAAGLANIDTLGVRGGAIHSAEEFILLESLTERAELTARILLKCQEKSC